MSFPLGPSFMLAAAVCEAGTEVTLRAIQAAWERWGSPGRFQRKLERLERKGWVERGRPIGRVDRIVRLTEEGRRVAAGGRDPEKCWRREWDGRWRVVLFDVPEPHRELRLKLWRRLRSMGFGYLQQSVWVSPDPARALREIVRAGVPDVETFSLLEASPCGGESDADLVAGAWEFDRINAGYARHLEILADRPRPARRASFRQWLMVEWQAWARAVSDDPLLPMILLPPGYLGMEAWHRRRESRQQMSGML